MKKKSTPVFSGPSGRKERGGMPFTSKYEMGQVSMSYEEASSLFKEGFVASEIEDLQRPVSGILDLVREHEIHEKISKMKGLRYYGTTGLHPEMTQELLDYDISCISRALAERGIVLEKPQGSSLHHLFDWIKDEPSWKEWTKFLEISGGQTIHDVYQSFVVEHDWAKLLEGKIDDGDFPLPFDGTCFEFRITGMRVLFLISCGPGSNMSNDVQAKMVVGVNGRWHINADRFYFDQGKMCSRTLNRPIESTEFKDGGWAESFLLMIGRQIKATCVMLDAKVVERETIRVSEKLNRQREKKGKAPLKPYHVVSLARRHRAAPLPEDHVAQDRRSPRMHMRRGHWRHYSDHRTWINWMLVGDETVGFVDKEYRL